MTPTTTREHEQAYYRRLGGLIGEGVDPNMRMSRARQICKTWRSHVAWHLANALARTTAPTTKGRR